jgi:hypothetical protein
VNTNWTKNDADGNLSTELVMALELDSKLDLETVTMSVKAL